MPLVANWSNLCILLLWHKIFGKNLHWHIYYFVRTALIMKKLPTLFCCVPVQKMHCCYHCLQTDTRRKPGDRVQNFETFYFENLQIEWNRANFLTVLGFMSIQRWYDIENVNLSWSQKPSDENEQWRNLISGDMYASFLCNAYHAMQFCTYFSCAIFCMVVLADNISGNTCFS